MNWPASGLRENSILINRLVSGSGSKSSSSNLKISAPGMSFNNRAASSILSQDLPSARSHPREQRLSIDRVRHDRK